MRIIETANAPSGNAAGRFPYGQVVVAGGLAFVSGQGPFGPATGAIVGSRIHRHPLQVDNLPISITAVAEA